MVVTHPGALENRMLGPLLSMCHRLRVGGPPKRHTLMCDIRRQGFREAIDQAMRVERS